MGRGCATVGRLLLRVQDGQADPGLAIRGWVTVEFEHVDVEGLPRHPLEGHGSGGMRVHFQPGLVDVHQGFVALRLGQRIPVHQFQADTRVVLYDPRHRVTDRPVALAGLLICRRLSLQDAAWRRAQRLGGFPGDYPVLRIVLHVVGEALLGTVRRRRGRGFDWGRGTEVLGARGTEQEESTDQRSSQVFSHIPLAWLG